VIAMDTGHEPAAEGWELRFVTDEIRAREMVRLYRELGFETAIEPAGPADVRPDCGECPVVRLRLLHRVSTRRPVAGERGGRGGHA
jgi:hypothetical protein